MIGRRERARDLAAAREAFERAAGIADGEEFAVRRINALHELGTIEMIQGGDTARLSEASELARQAGAICHGDRHRPAAREHLVPGTDLDKAMAAARRCEQGARLIKAPRIEALALAAQAQIYGIEGERKAAKVAVRRAESILPDDAEVLAATWGQARVAASLFRDDVAQRGAGERGRHAPRRAGAAAGSAPGMGVLHTAGGDFGK